jgi:CRISPR-associated protein Csb2
MLTIEVEFLTGVACLANERGDGADWPPQPDRLFSALVATWAARGERPEERAALEWLERALPPDVEASACHPRTSIKSYVPPNDDPPSKRSVLPQWRRRQERRFPAVVPLSPIVRWCWPEEPEEPMLRALKALAHDTSYLGHSTSLVRCTLLAKPRGDAPGVPARRLPYLGRLAELERTFRAGRRPSPGLVAQTPSRAAVEAPSSAFGTDWVVFADAGGFCPDAVAAPLATWTMLRAVLAGYGSEPVPAWVSGHEPDGSPLKTPHLAAVPLLDAGWHWSQGRLMGLALILPRALEAAARRARDPEAEAADTAALHALAEEDGFYRALARLNADDADALEIALRLPGGREWRLRRQAGPEAKSLRPARYAASARCWATVTPIALDRHPKASGEEEDGLCLACERIGLPRPIRVVVGKHAAVSGAPSASPAARAPDWTGWRLPDRLAGRRLTHAVVEFAEKVRGPVVLGAGRFLGLGLCLPLTDPPAP